MRTAKSRDEYVMVFPSALLRRIGYFQGLSFEPEKYMQVILEDDGYRFMKREDAEVDPDYKQLIPYVIFRYENGLFSYRRGKLLTEQRLLGNYSIGIGGHISVEDPSLFGRHYEEGLRREINEELAIRDNYRLQLVGLINDDTNEVGRVHFGVVHVATLESPSVAAREKSINEVKLLTVPELRARLDRYENWSKMCIEGIEQLLPVGT